MEEQQRLDIRTEEDEVEVSMTYMKISSSSSSSNDDNDWRRLSTVEIDGGFEQIISHDTDNNSITMMIHGLRRLLSNDNDDSPRGVDAFDKAEESSVQHQKEYNNNAINDDELSINSNEGEEEDDEFWDNEGFVNRSSTTIYNKRRYVRIGVSLLFVVLCLFIVFGSGTRECDRQTTLVVHTRFYGVYALSFY